MQISAARYLGILALCTLSLPVAAQTCAQADAKLAQNYQAMKEYGNYGSNRNPAKRQSAAREFETTLKNYLRQPDSERCSFRAAKEAGLEDSGTVGAIRVFSWDGQDSGTLHNERRLVRIKDAQNRIHFSSGEYGSIEQIMTDTLNGRRVYLLVGSNRSNSSTIQRYAEWYEVRGSRLVPLKLFNLGEPAAAVAYEYNFTSGNEPGDRGYFHYDAATHTLDHPAVNNGTLQQQQRVSYRFNGQKFVRVESK